MPSLPAALTWSVARAALAVVRDASYRDGGRPSTALRPKRLDRLGAAPRQPRPDQRGVPTEERMTHHDDDSRVIEAQAEAYNCRLVKRVDQTEDLAYFWVRTEGDPIPFEPGQYLTIGVFADGKLVQRPYSVASAPVEMSDGGYEFYVRLVPILRFTTLLWRLPIGHGMRIIGPKGRFLLEPDDNRTHLFVSTGTGIAPFISMIRQSMADRAPRKTVLLNGCSYVDELGYVAELEGLVREGRYPLRYVPTISRPSDPRNASWTGRTGRVEGIVGDVCKELGLRPDRTVVYICGNPDMIINVERELMQRGFPEFHVKKELYWPKGKDAALTGQATG
jgi:ferredoxin--NADP+ reductase